MDTTTPRLNPTGPQHAHPKPTDAAVRRRPENGLAALEWLLIVAAVAGLAALAVVLAQRVIDDTAEEIATSNARLTAAMIAAEQVETDARAAVASDNRTATWARWENHFASRCRRLAITYADVGAETDAAFARPSGASDGDPVDPVALGAAGEDEVDATTAQIKCDVTPTGPRRAVGPPGDNPPPAPPGIDLHAAQQAAAALEAEARTLRPGDTWETWETHFAPRCSHLVATYEGVRATAEFDGPTNKRPEDPVTQALLNAAAHTPEAADKPQLRCTVELAD